MSVQVLITRLDKSVPLPSYAKPGDAGMDLVAVSVSWDDRSGIVTYDTGLSIEIPEGYVGLLFPRSSVSKTPLQLTNCVGVIDSGYRGSMMFKYRCLNEEDDRYYRVGDRVGQIIIMPYPHIEFEEVEELSDTERGEGGFGSTGV